MPSHKIGMWMYQNSGGDRIQQKMIDKLRQRDILTVPELNLRDAVAKNGNVICKNQIMEELDLFFTYNAGEQTQYQTYLYEMVDNFIPTINSFSAFSLSEDKFKTAHLLRRHDINTADYMLCHRDDVNDLKEILRQWGGKIVYKPTDGWGGMGLVKIENEAALDMLLPFLNQTDIRYFYVERFIQYDNTDFRIDIVDGEFVSCYGRKAPKDNWKTNITSGGSVILREANDEVVSIAKKAAKICGLDIAGVDLIYDQEKEEYVVLEVNGIPAFATPQQEEMGLNFNDRKIDLIVNLIDRKIKEKGN